MKRFSNLHEIKYLFKMIAFKYIAVKRNFTPNLQAASVLQKLLKENLLSKTNS